MTAEGRIVTIEYLAQTAKWIETWVAVRERQMTHHPFSTILVGVRSRTGVC